MADPERFEIGLEGVTDDDVGGAALGCENARVVVATARDASGMPDHLDGRW